MASPVRNQGSNVYEARTAHMLPVCAIALQHAQFVSTFDCNSMGPPARVPRAGHATSGRLAATCHEHSHAAGRHFALATLHWLLAHLCPARCLWCCTCIYADTALHASMAVASPIHTIQFKLCLATLDRCPPRLPHLLTSSFWYRLCFVQRGFMLALRTFSRPRVAAAKWDYFFGVFHRLRFHHGCRGHATIAGPTRAAAMS